MRSKDKIDIRVKLVGKKPWAVVRDPKTGEDVLVPSFEDLFRIILAIVYCENRKYSDLPWPPSKMVRDFMVACVREADADELPLSAEAYEAAWAKLDAEFKITEGREKPSEAKVVCGPGCKCELCLEWPRAS